jgi:bifunctional UDP-N-acetylglucosamine pyrophosphorylase/glucosamine-1-phosphate N-acetyltransferase
MLPLAERRALKAVFLCGGISRRMFPFTEEKYLLSFLDKSLLEHQMEEVAKAGVRDFLVVVNPAARQRAEEAVSRLDGVSVQVALQEQPRGMGHALLSVREHLGTGPLLIVSPSDVVEPAAYTWMLTAAPKGDAVSYILGYRVNEYFPGGYLVVSPGGWVKEIAEKPGKGREPSQVVNIVVHLHTRPGKLLEALADEGGDGDDTYERALGRFMAAGDRMKVVPYEGFWGPIKYPWHILAVMEHLLQGIQRDIAPSAQIASSAVVEGRVVVGEGACIFENAVVRGPAYIGPGAVIGNNVLIRGGAHIGARSVVGFGTEIKHSYIGQDSNFHFGYVGDSIVGSGCNLGAGTITANLPFHRRHVRVKVGDEVVDTGTRYLGAMIGDNCQTGIHASLMPGVRMGEGSVLGPHLCLTHDLDAGARMLSDREQP